MIAERCGGSVQDCRGSLRGVALAAGLLVAALPATAAAAPGDATVFVQSAKSGKLDGGRLVLGGVNGRVSWATNSGRAGVIPLRRLHRHGFRPGRPASGTLHIAGQPGGQELAFRLSRPRYNPARNTVAYRAQPLAKRRAARAAGLGGLRRFAAASLSIIPHPDLMATGESGRRRCGITIKNNTGHPLFPNVGAIGDWNPEPPQFIGPGATATWAAVEAANIPDDFPYACMNAGSLSVGYSGDTDINLTFLGIRPRLPGTKPATDTRCSAKGPYTCDSKSGTLSPSGDNVTWTINEG
jgi:hypothetical protein